MSLHNNFIYKSILIFLACTIFIPANLNAWELVSQKDDILLYTQPVTDSGIKSVKAVVFARTDMDRLISLLMNISLYPEWITLCKEAHIVKNISDNEKIAYARIDLPWPARDREVNFRNMIIRDEITGVVTINMHALPGQASHDNEVVYLKKMTMVWKLTPLSDGTVKIVVSGHCDPQSRLPDSFINNFIFRMAQHNLHNMLEFLADQ